ncbi:hypothetical protein VNI00_013073 [Paramarasmius palmivorus]|uniref:Copper transport protein n=1 Tax=Paramarasmius palmivorus TaxID=297713 RepID=A0AAW0C081_9AGAR
MEAHWRKRAQIEYTNRLNANGTAKKPEPSLMRRLLMRNTLPFIPAHDIVRGIMQVGQAALGFALMLAVMTFQVAFLLSIVIGLGVGETLFGRFNPAAHIH